MAHLQCRKEAGVDGIPAEINNHGSPTQHFKLNCLLFCCRSQGKFPQDFRYAVVITLCKNKGERFNCYDYRGIKPTSVDYLPESYSTGSYQLSQKKICPQASVASVPTEARRTCCSSSVNSRKSAMNETRDSTLILSTQQMLLTQ